MLTSAYHRQPGGGRRNGSSPTATRLINKRRSTKLKQDQSSFSRSSISNGGDSFDESDEESSQFMMDSEIDSLPAVECPRVGHTEKVVMETALSGNATKKIDDQVWYNYGEKQPQVKKSDCLLIYPDSNGRFAWDMVGVALIIFQAVYVPYALCFNVQISAEMFIVESVMDAFFMFDIVLNFNTGFYDRGNLIMGRRAIIVNYVRGWFWLDLLASFPYTWVLPQQEGDDSSLYRTPQLLRILRILKFLKVLRLIRILKLKKLMIKFEDHIQLSSASIAILELIKLLLAIMFLAHWIACFWFFIGENSGDEKYYNWVTDNDLQDATIWSQYVAAMYWSFTTMTTVGYGDIKPITNDEKLFAIFGMFVACGVFAIAIGSLGAIFGKLYEKDMMFRQRMQSVSRYLNSRKVPKDIQFVVRRYVEYVWEKKERFSVSEEERVLNMLSPALRLQLKLLSTHGLFENFPVFAPLNKFMINSLAVQLTEEIFAPGDVICKQGDYGDTLYFLTHGNVGVINQERFLARIEKESYFGEISFFSGGPRTATITALEFVETYSLRKSIFQTAICSTPKKKIRRKYEELCRDLRRKNYRSLDVVCFICDIPGHIASVCEEPADLMRSSSKAYKRNLRISPITEEIDEENTVLEPKKSSEEVSTAKGPNTRKRFYKWWPFSKAPDSRVSTNSLDKTQETSQWNHYDTHEQSTRIPLNHSRGESNASNFTPEQKDDVTPLSAKFKLPEIHQRRSQISLLKRQSNTVQPADFDRIEMEDYSVTEPKTTTHLEAQNGL